MNRTSHCPDCPDCPARRLMDNASRETFIYNTYFGLYVRAEASRLCWDGKESVLISCRQVFQ